MKRPIIGEISLNPVKVMIVIAFVIAMLALDWEGVLLLIVIAAYEWGYLKGDPR